MNRESVAEAVARAQLFLEREKEWQAAEQKATSFPYSTRNPRESGALKRASLDLTRALAAMRKPG